jgi:hypothetical protein
MKVFSRFIFNCYAIIQKFQWFILSIFVLGLVDLFAYYEVATSFLALLATEFAPIIGIILFVILVWGILKRIKKRKKRSASAEE